jgi:hypothetical protein
MTAWATLAPSDIAVVNLHRGGAEEKNLVRGLVRRGNWCQRYMAPFWRQPEAKDENGVTVRG